MSVLDALREPETAIGEVGVFGVEIFGEEVLVRFRLTRALTSGFSEDLFLKVGDA